MRRDDEPQSDDRFDDDELPPRVPTGTGRRLLLALVVDVLVLLALIWPFDFAAPAAGSVGALPPTSVWQLLLGFALFVPMGFFEARLAVRFVRSRNVALFAVVADAIVLALIGETVQLWLPARDSSLIDIVTAVMGAIVGFQFVASPRGDESAAGDEEEPD